MPAIASTVRPALAAVTLLASLSMTACSSTSGTVTPAAPVGSSTSVAGSSGAPAPSAVLKPPITSLKTSTTSLGDVVVDGGGMTLYMFTKDTQGATSSACTGACLTAWPLTVADAAPALTSITGTVGSIATADGRKQVTLNGWPLYYFAKDKAPGDVLGQGVNSVWYVLDKTGTPIK